MALSSTSRPSVRLKAGVKIPASFNAEGGFAVSKENGIWTLEPAWEDLEQVTVLPEPEDKEVWVRDVNTDVYYRLTVQALIDNLPIGPAGEITIGTTTALAAGNTPTVANVGTDTEAILNFGIPRGADAGIKWLYDSSTSMADPGTGDIRFNNATLASVTAIAVSATGSGADISDWVATWDDSTNPTVKAYLIVREEAAATAAIFSLSAVTDNTDWLQLTVAYVAGSLSLTAADPLYVTPLRIGNKGTDGAGTGDVVGPASALNGSIPVYSGTTGKLLADAAVVLSAFAKTILDDADASAVRTTLGLVIGTNVQAPATTLSGYGITNARGQGKETVWIPAGAMISRTTNGPAAGTVETTTNKNMFKTLDFDTATQEFAQFEIFFPKSWNLSTVTFQPVWSHAATTTNFGVVWGLAGVARSDDDAGDVAFGTAATSTDTGGTTNDIYIGPESAAITIAGTPTAGDTVQFQLNRTVADAGDTMAIDARLHGIRLFFTTNATTDA